MTQTEKARKGVLTPALKKIAAAEGVAPEKLAGLVASGFVVIPFNIGAETAALTEQTNGNLPSYRFTHQFESS